MNQLEAIRRMIDAHNRAVRSAYVVTREPDVENRDTADVDAYAESVGLPPLAIEHTTIPTLQDQVRDSAWFLQGLGPLEDELAGVFPFHLDVVIPYKNVEPGTNWTSIREHLRDWLIANSPGLPDGHSSCTVPGVPFRLTVRKRTNMEPRVFLMREVPPGDQQELLLREMQKGLDHKYARLGEYRAGGATTVLVLQSDDIALVSPQSLYQAYLRATREQPRPALDQIWMVSAMDPIYCFHGPAEVLAAVNPPNFRFGPQYVGEWLQTPNT